MRPSRHILCGLVVLLLTVCPTLFGQTVSRQRPSLSAAQALQVAERFVTEQHLDISGHFVSAVRYFDAGSFSHDKGPYWIVTYELIAPSDGGQHFIVVHMDGSSERYGGL